MIVSVLVLRFDRVFSAGPAWSGEVSSLSWAVLKTLRVQTSGHMKHVRPEAQIASRGIWSNQK